MKSRKKIKEQQLLLPSLPSAQQKEAMDASVAPSKDNPFITEAALTDAYSRYRAGVVLSGAIDGINRVFTMADTPVENTEMVFINGILLRRGSDNDYIITGGTIEFEDGDEPLTGSILTATYFI